MAWERGYSTMTLLKENPWKNYGYEQCARVFTFAPVALPIKSARPLWGDNYHYEGYFSWDQKVYEKHLP